MAPFSLASLPHDLRDVCVTFDLWNPLCTYVFYIVWMFHYLFSIKVLPVLRVLLRTQAVFFPFLWNRQSSSFHFAVCDLYFSVCMCLLVQFGGHGKYVYEKILLWGTFSNSFCSFGSQYHTLYKSYFGNNTFKEFLHRIMTFLCVKDNNNHLTEDYFFLSALIWGKAGSLFLFPLLFSQASNGLKQNKHTEKPFTHKRAFKVLERSKK